MNLDYHLNLWTIMQVFITQKEHRKNFGNSPTCILINPTKSGLHKISSYHAKHMGLWVVQHILKWSLKWLIYYLFCQWLFSFLAILLLCELIWENLYSLQRNSSLSLCFILITSLHQSRTFESYVDFLINHQEVESEN